MQNSQHTAATGGRVAPCFHHRGTMGCSAIPEIPPWLQQCYTTGQISGGDSSQQGSQHFHQSAMYLTHEGPIIQADRYNMTIFFIQYFCFCCIFLQASFILYCMLYFPPLLLNALICCVCLVLETVGCL
jgi:hypothetical protein